MPVRAPIVNVMSALIKPKPILYPNCPLGLQMGQNSSADWAVSLYSVYSILQYVNILWDFLNTVWFGNAEMEERLGDNFGVWGRSARKEKYWLWEGFGVAKWHITFIKALQFQQPSLPSLFHSIGTHAYVPTRSLRSSSSILQCYFQPAISWGGFPPPRIPNPPQKNTQNTKNIKKCIKFTPQICVPPPEHGV